jgi:hypothetical protein
LGSFSRASRSKQGIAQPRGISEPNVERFAKDASLVSASRMRWAEAVVFELSNIEVGFVGIGQARHRR